ncbi:MAG: hypothetical protein KAS13_05555 [Candidatus Omnitrophica bacterium]|nr:hypothetical protein [Candidatus Omnitrophota bacterium]
MHILGCADLDVYEAGLKVMANDFLISEAMSRSTFQISEFMPLLSFSILESLDIFINVNRMFSSHIEQIKPKIGKCRQSYKQSYTILTAFLPYSGYKKAAWFVKEIQKLKEDDLEAIPEREIRPGFGRKSAFPVKLGVFGL